jgi:hypothetical protein
MDILGIGPLEFLFILLIALIVLGPKDMVKAGKTIGRYLRAIVTHPAWHSVQRTSRDLRNLPNRLIREAGLEDLKDQIPDSNDFKVDIEDAGTNSIDPRINLSSGDFSDWVTPPEPGNSLDTAADNPSEIVAQAEDTSNTTESSS